MTKKICEYMFNFHKQFLCVDLKISLSVVSPAGKGECEKLKIDTVFERDVLWIK